MLSSCRRVVMTVTVTTTVTVKSFMRRSASLGRQWPSSQTYHTVVCPLDLPAILCFLCPALQEGGDDSKEEERKFRRAVFSFERWAAHRSTSRCMFLAAPAA
jgi:hypothetical protein